MNDSELVAAARQFGTPLYMYDFDIVHQRFDALDHLFGKLFGVSFAVKSNPNISLLSAIKGRTVSFDVSSFAEVERALAAGAMPGEITFSGPGKRQEEICRAVAKGIGELVVESVEEARIASKAAKQYGVQQDVLVRINPIRAPRHFGVSMAGKPSQFGVDEEELSKSLKAILLLDGLRLKGFHIYSGTNSLKPEAIAENFSIFIEIFKKAVDLTGRPPEKLIFGSGFGLPYLAADTPLDVEFLATLVRPMIEELKADARFSECKYVLEMGRWLIGPAGWLLTKTVSAKSSRGTEFRLCDAGFNNHLAACGMMGSVIRRNWQFSNISRPGGKPTVYTLTGPLCTTIDVLASDIELPELAVGDVISIKNSGAYGLTASPTRFISHPEPREVAAIGGELTEITESTLNHWDRNEWNSSG